MERPGGAVRRWRLWRLPPAVVGYVVAVIVAPVAVLALMLWRQWPHRPADLGGLLLLGLFAVASIEGARRIGLPAQTRGRPTKDLLPVWIVAIALVLPAVEVVLAAAALVPLLIRGDGQRPYRRAFNAAVVALSGLAAHAAAQAATDGATRPVPAAAGERLVVAVGVALLAYEVVNITLVTAAILLTERGTALRGALGGAATLVTDGAALAVGALTAVAWSTAPVLAALAVPPVVLLQRALIHDELRAAAQTDAKTGLASSAYWAELSRRCVERASRDGAPCGVLLVDVDLFKQVNDTWGHLAGDQVLAAVGQVLRLGVRPGDAVGRLGGEEFGVLLPDADPAEAAAIAERLRAAVAARRVPVRGALGQGVVQVTISVGVASTAAAGYAVGDLLASADAALYQAKADGRDRVASGGPVSGGDRLWLSGPPPGVLPIQS